jgi:hypothetical protein
LAIQFPIFHGTFILIYFPVSLCSTLPIHY